MRRVWVLLWLVLSCGRSHGVEQPPADHSDGRSQTPDTAGESTEEPRDAAVVTPDTEIPCTPQMRSTALVGMPGIDPCPQNTSGCPSSCTPGGNINSATPGVNVPCPSSGGFIAISTCGADMRWSKTCQCTPKPMGSSTQPVCGNNFKEGVEQCDGPVPADISCARMMAGGMGTISCSATCQLQIACTTAASR